MRCLQGDKMSDNNINIGVKVTPSGVSELVKDTGQVAENLKQAAAASTKIRKPKALAAAEAGLDAKAQASSDSNTARGIGGATGAAGRDFAAQARGLGGLVHVYATFAANIFAVSAAFTALSKAADTANLLKGMEQLGAASGRNLGAMAQSLIKVTDGAISLREASEAVNKAVSSGLDASNIQKIGLVAQGASKALGVNMTDAVSRLTRGITKLEPELLDELGIFTRVDKASQDYARSIGKTAGSLTDFEKRQAFANAVLKEGMDKFSVIELPANPFNKLQASAENTLQGILELINKGLGPVAKFLGESPTALATAMAGIATILIKQAIPALTVWRENARKAADDAAESAKKIHANFEEFDIQRKLAVAGPIAQKAAAEANAHIAGVQTALAKALSGRSKLLQSAMSGSVDAEEIGKQIQTQIKTADTYLTKLTEARKLIKDTDTDHLAAMDADISKQKEKLGLLKQAGMLASMAAKEQLAERKALDAAEHNAAMDPRFLSEGWQRKKNADAAQNSANRRAILANVADNTQNMGIKGAFSNLFDDIKNGAKVVDSTTGSMTRMTNTSGIVGKSITAISGSFRILTSSMMTALSAFSEIGMILAALGVAYSLLDGFLSKAAEQQEKFNDTITEAKTASKTAADALDFLGTKSKTAIDIKGIQAMSNALDGITVSIQNQIVALKKLNDASGWWDNFKDRVAGIFGKSNADILARTMGEQIQASLGTLVFTPGLQKEYISGLSKLLNVPAEKLGSSTAISKAIETQIKQMGGLSGATELLKQIEVLQSSVASKDAQSTAAAKALSDSLVSVGNEVDTILGKLQFKDGLGKLGSLVVTMGNSMAAAMQNPIKSLKTLTDMASDPKLLGILSSQGFDTSKLISQISTLKDLEASVNVNAKTIAEAQASLDKLIKENKASFKSREKVLGTGGYIEKDTAEAAKLKGVISGAKAGQAELTAQIKAINDQVFGPVLGKLNEAGQAMITTALKDAIAKGEISKSMSELTLAQKAGVVTADREAGLRLQELDLRLKEAQASYNLQLAIIANTTAIEEANAKADLKNAEKGSLAEQNAKDILAAIALSKQLSGKSTKESQATLTEMTGGTGVSDKVINMARMKSQQVDQAGMQFRAAGASIEAEKYNVRLNAGYNLLVQQNAQLAKRIDLELQNISLQEQAISGFEKYTTTYNKTLADAADSLARQRVALQYAKELLAITEKQKALDLTKKYSPARDGLAPTDSEAQALIDAEKRVADEKERQSRLAIEINSYAKQQQKLAEEFTRELNNQSQIQGLIRDQQAVSDDADKAKLDRLISYGALSAEEAAKETARIATNRAERERSAAIELANTKRLGEAAIANAKLNSAIKAAEALPVGAERDAAISQAAQEYANTTSHILAVQERSNKLAEDKYALAMKNLEVAKAEQTALGQTAVLVKTLGGLFGEKGKALGDTFGTILKLGQRQKELDKTNTNQTEFQIEATRELAGATKHLFKEKSAGYKIMETLEKAAMAAQLARTAMTIASNVGLTSSNIATGVSSLFATGGWAGFVGAAAFLALMSSLGHGGTKGVPAGGFDAKAQQEVQGTGQMYNAEGKIVDRAGGNLGDPTGKSKAIDNSISMLEKYSFKNLEYSNAMLDNLKAIKRNTAGLVSVLIQAGIGFGKSNITKGIATGTLNTGRTRDYSIEGNVLMSIFGKDSGIGKELGRINSKIFGGKTTASIEDSGITIMSSLGSALDKNSKTIKEYANLLVHTSGGLFRSSKDSREVRTADVNDQIGGFVRSTLTALKTSALEAFAILGGDKQLANTLLDSMNLQFKASFQGMKPDEMAAALDAEFGVAFGAMAETIVPQLKEIQQGGENLGETLVRVANDWKTIDLALFSVGTTINRTGSLLDKVDLNTKLAEAFGGMEEFTSQIDFFRTNFLTSAEQLAPVQQKLAEGLDKLGLSGLNSREAFAKTFKALDLTTESGRNTAAAMMDLAPAFAEVYQETRKVISAEEYRKSLAQQQIEIYNLEGRSAEALFLQRKEELAQMDDRLRNGQLYIYALQDENALRTKLKTAYDNQSNALKNTISTLKSSIKTLNDYRTSLALSAESNLSPEQKYQEAKAQMQAISAAAGQVLSDSATEAEKQAKQDAINKLPQVASAFLNASRVMFASSDMYNQDYAATKEIINSTSLALEQQQTDTEKMLDSLNLQVGALISIDAEVATTNQIMEQLKVAQENTRVAMEGARDAGLIANGITLENNVKVENLFGNLILEVTKLREEVVALRADQAQQTQDTINANDQSNQTNANIVVDGIKKIPEYYDTWVWEQNP